MNIDATVVAWSNRRRRNGPAGRDRGVVFARITQKEESEDADERS